MNRVIRDVDPDALAAIHRMNECALPHVNSVPLEYFRRQAEGPAFFRAAFGGGEPIAFLLAMDQESDYDSLNFLWFKARYPQFVYIDRVVVTETHRRSGLAAALYEELGRWARGRSPLLACEVNTRPVNEPSMRFHESQGFDPVGSQETDGGRKTVCLMVREVAA